MNKKQGKVGQARSEIVAQIPMACACEDSAVEFMESRRWGDTPQCACCDSENVYQQMNADKSKREAHYRWRCRDCKKQYSVRKGTVLEGSRIPLRHWCFAFWAACSSKKGVSAKQIQRQTGLSYKSALFLMHRIRFAMAPSEPDPKLDGIVEVDETYVGGKPRNKGWKFGDPNRRAQWSTKTRVVGMVQRDGEVRAQVAPTITAKNLREIVMGNVDTTARLIT
ncbi:MAG: IS1595 family transposase, partial [Phycisphaerales bacterium]|nr:IS1595 family transposase [Phycisphaerales bacterium]